MCLLPTIGNRGLGFLFFLCLPLALSGVAQEPPSPTPVDQRDFADSANGCAPATLLNLLRFGGPEYAPVLDSIVGTDEGVMMRFLVDRYFRHRPSLSHPGQMRWGVHGVEWTDFSLGINELLADHGIAPLAAVYLDRSDGEEEQDHLARVHRMIRASLEAGTPPVLSLRSFVVKRLDRNGGRPHWETGIGHYLLITGIRNEPSATGCELEAIDPWEGRRTVLYLHRESNGRSFRALKGVQDRGEWLDGRPFLQVLAPDSPTLRPANVAWDERYLLIANYLIGNF